MENKENILEDQKKTDFPDLELPDHNSFKHFYVYCTICQNHS